MRDNYGCTDDQTGTIWPLYRLAASEDASVTRVRPKAGKCQGDVQNVTKYSQILPLSCILRAKKRGGTRETAGFIPRSARPGEESRDS